MEQEELKEVRGLNAFIDSLRVGMPQRFRNMTVCPIYSEMSMDNGFVTLDEAVGTGRFVITELSEGGSVPELKVVNGLLDEVVVLDGEELRGAKQNRIVNTTIVVGRGREVVIPVSCVERSRWSYRTRTFAAGGSQLYADLRMKKSRAVTRNLKARKAFYSDQNEIWEDIQQKAACFRVNSETEAMGDIYADNEKDLKEYEEAFAFHPNQVGLAVMIGGRLVGCDVFSDRSLFKKIFSGKKVLRSYILDALDHAGRGDRAVPPAGGEDEGVAASEVERFLRRAKGLKKESFKSVGEGNDVRFGGRSLSGFALMKEDEVVHLAVFANA